MGPFLPKTQKRFRNRFQFLFEICAYFGRPYFEKKPFDEEVHKKYLKHEKIENLAGLEMELVYEWELGSMLIFDRTNLHCSSSKIEGKKIGLTTFTKK